MAWTYSLNITNETDRDLEVFSSELSYGYWNTDGVEDRAPRTIPAKSTVQAVGVKSSSGTWRGYEFSVSWRDVPPAGELPRGTIDLMIDVPYSRDNRSYCTSTGLLKIEGWKNLPPDGHNFTQSIVISTAGSRLDAPPPPLELDADDHEYVEFLRRCRARNPNVRDWSAVQALPIIDGIHLPEQFPPDVDLAPRIYGRSDAIDIPKRLWGGISDPEFPSLYAQQLVSRYFAVSLYGYATDGRAIISLARGEGKSVEERVEITSAISRVLTINTSIKTLLSSTERALDPAGILGAEVAAQMEASFSIDNVRSESTTKVTSKSVTQTFTAINEYDRWIVPWVFSQAALIYREDENGKIELLAFSDWAKKQLACAYIKPGPKPDPEEQFLGGLGRPQKLVLAIEAGTGTSPGRAHLTSERACG